jgi:hypothetical protein
MSTTAAPAKSGQSRLVHLPAQLVVWPFRGSPRRLILAPVFVPVGIVAIALGVVALIIAGFFMLLGLLAKGHGDRKYQSRIVARDAKVRRYNRRHGIRM